MQVQLNRYHHLNDLKDELYIEFEKKTVEDSVNILFNEVSKNNMSIEQYYVSKKFTGVEIKSEIFEVIKMLFIVADTPNNNSHSVTTKDATDASWMILRFANELNLKIKERGDGPPFINEKRNLPTPEDLPVAKILRTEEPASVTSLNLPTLQSVSCSEPDPQPLESDSTEEEELPNSDNQPTNESPAESIGSITKENSVNSELINKLPDFFKKTDIDVMNSWSKMSKVGNKTPLAIAKNKVKVAGNIVTPAYTIQRDIMNITNKFTNSSVPTNDDYTIIWNHMKQYCDSNLKTGIIRRDYFKFSKK